MTRKHALALFATLALVLLVLDRVTKAVAIDQLANAKPIAFLPALLDFVLVYNTGGAFSIFEGGAVFFVGVAVCAVAVIIAFLLRASHLRPPVVIALSLISAGALGNAWDRAVNGAVPDFIHTLFIEFPVFNVADICLTVGEAVLIVAVAIYWFGPRKQEDTQGEAAPAADTQEATTPGSAVPKEDA
jgi:signal peptidase II